VVFPDSNYGPIPRAKQLRNETVSGTVRFDLVSPEVVVMREGSASARTPVPKTPVEKDGYSLLRKDEVRMAEKFVVAPPTGNTFGLENGEELQLGCLILAAAHSRHVV
jgi:hypothetical protein